MRDESTLAVLAEERLDEVIERAEKIAERDPLVDGEPLDLVERRRMRRVGCVTAIHAPRAHDVDRRLARLHGADLRRRRLRAEDCVFVEEERLQRRPGRMPGREVERVEVVMRRLHLAAVDHRVPHPQEDVLELAPDLRDEVEMTASYARAGHRDVDALLDEAAVELRSLQCGVTLVDRRLELLPQRVERHPRLAIAYLPQCELQLALAAEELDADALISSIVVAAAAAASAAFSSAWASTGAPRLPTCLGLLESSA